MNETGHPPLSRSALRKRMRSRRLALPPGERIAAADKLSQTLEQLPEFLVDQCVAGYWAVAGEMPLHAAFARLRARDQTYSLPIIDDNDHLRFAAWRTGQPLRTNRYGIPEPEIATAGCLTPAELDLVLMPLLGFDRNGNRLGSGAGFYDRSFAFLRTADRPAKPVLVGIGYHFQEVSNLVAEPWDVAMDFIATDRELIACSTDSF